MSDRIKRTQIAYRCPDCGVATVGFLGGLSAVSDMLRLRCGCGESSLDITNKKDGKLQLTVPCVYCKDTHSFVLQSEILLRDDKTLLSCPFSGMDIAFIGDEETISTELERSANELSRIMQSLEAEDLSDIQPQDVDAEDAPPDPGMFDSINFLVRDLEADGAVKCPCGKDRHELRFTDNGMQVYCPDCGASYDFYCKTVSAAEEYLSIDEITLR